MVFFSRLKYACATTFSDSNFTFGSQTLFRLDWLIWRRQLIQECQQKNTTILWKVQCSTLILINDAFQSRGLSSLRRRWTDAIFTKQPPTITWAPWTAPRFLWRYVELSFLQLVPLQTEVIILPQNCKELRTYLSSGWKTTLAGQFVTSDGLCRLVWLNCLARWVLVVRSHCCQPSSKPLLNANGNTQRLVRRWSLGQSLPEIGHDMEKTAQFGWVWIVYQTWCRLDVWVLSKNLEHGVSRGCLTSEAKIVADTCFFVCSVLGIGHVCETSFPKNRHNKGVLDSFESTYQSFENHWENLRTLAPNIWPLTDLTVHSWRPDRFVKT